MGSALGRLKRFALDLAGKDDHLTEVTAALSQTSGRLIDAALARPDQLLEALSTGSEGLTEAEAEARFAQHGRNEVAHERAPTWYRQLLMACFNPFVGILLILAAASFVTEYVLAPVDARDLSAVIIISVLMLASVLLTFIQEYQANQAAERLLSLIQSTSLTLRRDSGRQRVATTRLVPGDIILLSAGDIIPADVRLLAANSVTVNQAALTGESLPVEKSVAHDSGLPACTSEINVLELTNIGFTGTNVVSGTARALVLATAGDTYLGSMAGQLVGHHPPTSFDLGLKSVSVLLIRFMLLMVPIIFLVSGLVRGDWLGALLFGLAVAVGLTPEMLPTIVAANLAKGTLEMARHKTIVRRLSAIQNLGAMDVLCTDKTGTLTYDSVALETHVDVLGRPSGEVLRFAVLNSSFQEGLDNPLDDAILAHPEAASLASADELVKVGEVPFETTRRRMSVILSDPEGSRILICKGAVEEMLHAATTAVLDGVCEPLTPRLRADITERAAALNRSGLRVLLVGLRRLGPAGAGGDRYGPDVERELALVGLVGFSDPPKETSGPALDALRQLGVRVSVITGDNEVATRRICREIGFEITGLVQGQDVERMRFDRLRQVVERDNVFVRVSPLAKSRIVKALKANGHTVGFLGDGINDAPALRDADVGISVDNAVDIAKESAAIILLEKNLLVLAEGVRRGRVVFGNIMKYIKMTLSSNFGNVFSVLLASAVIPFPPMLPLHLLLQNLIYDASQLSIPWDRVDQEYLARPRRWDPAGILRFTVLVGPVSSIFDLTTFAVLWYVLGANTAAQQDLFHSGWFVLGLVSQVLIVHMIRTSRIPFIQSTASVPVLVATGLAVLAGLVIPFTAFGLAVGFVPLPAAYFLWLVPKLLLYCLAIQAIKVWHIRKFGSWL